MTARGGAIHIRVAKYAFLSVAALVMVAPLLYAVYVSVQVPRDFGHWVSPAHLTLSNYEYVFTHAPIGRWYANTLLVTTGVVIGCVVVNTAAGYALARIAFPGRWLVFGVVLLVLMVPLQAILIPLYLLVAKLHWLNSYQSLIVPFIVNPFLIFLMRQSFTGLPRELEEAAAVDGAGRLRTFARIAVPLTMTGIATQAILAGTWTWNSFMIPVTFISDRNRFVLPVGLNSIQSQFYTLPTIQMAGVVILTVPIVVMFLLFQRLIVPSIATAGLRG
jgi:multiple sugar transport system permease protein